MSLKFRIPAGEKIVVNGAVLTNTNNKAMHFSLENDAAIMRERDILLPENVKTPLENVYLYVQLMYIEPDNLDAHHRSFQEAAQLAFLSTLDDKERNIVFEIVGLVGEKNYYAALKKLQKSMNLSAPKE
ncbi:MAG: flagellar biosynthesis repressor FlbT [Sneathiella sp.]|nr:flagellar biosynthesis repressor FlbT [Sneathiella sp.]